MQGGPNMKTLVKPRPIPKGYHTVTPFIVVTDLGKAIEFYKNAFGAVERGRFEIPGTGHIMHAEIQIGDSIAMLSDESPEMNAFAPGTLKGVSSGLYLYVEDVDGFVYHALQN